MQTHANQKGSIQLTIVALSWLLLLSAGSVQAQTQERPKPGPEQKKLEVWVGEWKYEGSAKDSPLGPGGKFAGKQTARMILGGLFLETRWEDKGTYGGQEMILQGIDVQWYDALTKKYVDHAFDNDGSASTGVTTVNGNTWTSMSTRTDTKGKTFKVKGTSTLSSDGKTCAASAEVSADDGKTWTPLWELTLKKVKK
jgi:hypothetical protein